MTESNAPQPLTIALLGATGFVGSHIAEEADRRGHRLVRVTAPRLAWTPDAAGLDLDSLLPADDFQKLRSTLSAADAVINAAGLSTPEGADPDLLFGANAALPGLLGWVTAGPLLHISSAAVLGAGRLHARRETAPFSDYSRSKALGEELLLGSAAGAEARPCILRATSVQGAQRHTTQSFVRFARGPLASWCEDRPVPLTSATALARLALGLVEDLCSSRPVPEIVLQPWEGATTRSALEAAADGRPVRRIPGWIGRALLAGAVQGGSLPGSLGQKGAATARRLELLWFGQPQTDAWPRASELAGTPEIHEALRATGRGQS